MKPNNTIFVVLRATSNNTNNDAFNRLFKQALPCINSLACINTSVLSRHAIFIETDFDCKKGSEGI